MHPTWDRIPNVALLIHFLALKDVQITFSIITFKLAGLNFYTKLYYGYSVLVSLWESSHCAF